MYDFVRGPLVWIAAIGFIGGSLYKIVSMALLAKKERIVFPTYDFKYGARSVVHWIIPFGTRNMRLRPLFTLISFAFHFCLLVTPLFVMGHAVLWHESWGVRWWSLPESVADIMTLVVICGGLLFAIRRMVFPEVRNVTGWRDYLLVLLVVAPFLTAFIAHRQWLPYRPMLMIHIITGALWLIAIPFTRLAHMFWFIFSRAYMGSEFGAVRNARDW
jgi:nitrate reductase gamma subunit